MPAPTLSCVMPTRNRPAFVRQALRYFARQSLASRELVVVDDGAEAVQDLCVGPAVRYIRCAPGQLSLGAKLNLGIEHASGEFIVKWDDDDWYRRDFAATMLAALRTAPEPDQVAAACGCYRVFVAGERFFRFSGRTNGGGGTLTFAKSLWRRVPFRDVQGDEDAWFRTDIGRPLVLVDEPQIYVVIRHGGNTWVRNRNGQTTDRVFLGRPPVSENLRCLFSPKEAEFYLSLPAVPALLSRAARRTAAPRAPSR